MGVLEDSWELGLEDATPRTGPVLVTILALLAVSRRRREAGEAGRLWARRERWVAPDGGRTSLGADTVVGEVQGLEGLGHLEEGSGQTGLLGWEVGPCGRGFNLEAVL